MYFHQEQGQQIPTTSKERKLLAPTHNNFGISALRSPYFIYILKHMKTFISNISVQLNIHHARKAQSCSCSEQDSCWAQHPWKAEGPPQGHTNLWFGSHSKGSSSHLFAPQPPLLPRISLVLLKTHVNQEIF